MSMEWFRWHDGTVTDPKLALIAKKSGESRPVVIAVWAALLEQGSRAEQRGSITDFDLETMAVALDIEEDAIHAVIGAMTDKGMIKEGRLTAWDKRQPAREDATASARVQAYRERKRHDETASNDTKRDETHGNAQKRNETPVTPLDTDTDTDTEGEGEEKAKSVAPAPDPTPPLLAEPLPAEPAPAPAPKPKASSQPTKTAKRPIAADWQPAESTYALLETLGIDRPFAASCVPEFVLYWQERGESRPGWEASFVNSAKRSWEKRPAVPGGGRAPSPAVERFDPHAKHARLVAANQAAVAEWLAQDDSANPWGITVLPPPELTHAPH